MNRAKLLAIAAAHGRYDARSTMDVEMLTRACGGKRAVEEMSEREIFSCILGRLLARPPSWENLGADIEGLSRATATEKHEFTRTWAVSWAKYAAVALRKHLR